MRQLLVLGSILCALVTACSSSSAPIGTRPGSGGSGGTVSSGAGTGGALNTSGSSTGGVGNGGGASPGGATSVSTGGTSGAGAAGITAAAGSGGTSSLTCGYKNQGHVLQVSADIALCIPPQTCLPETCPPTLGTCVNDRCVFNAGYAGLETLPEAWATHYCDLQAGACQGVHQFDPVLTTAQSLAAKSSLPLCKSSAAGAECVGIVASPPMMIGNREKFGQAWGLGLTEASGLCYEVTGPGGAALLAITDRCGGYCKCPSLGATEFNECGQCKEAADLTPLCECRGDNNCGGQQCDWCAANNHPHFDLDDDTFTHICGDQALKGSCQLASAKFVPCLDARADWPPPL